MTDSLRDIQQQSGATFAGDPSAPPLDFGDPRAEYRAARSAGALFDLGPRTQFALTGADRHKFLHNFCTNDINRLPVGQNCEAFLTNVKGRILGHVFVFAEPDSLWIDTVPGQEDALLAHLDRYLIREDVAFERLSAAQGELLLTGPSSSQVLESAAPGAGPLAPFSQMRVEHGPLTGSVRRVDGWGAPAYLVSAPLDALSLWWMALTAAGAHPAGSQVFDALRIEAGIPHYGVDLSDDNLAQEAARTTRAISFTKGCYLGQEPIARIDAMGHVNHELRGLRLAGTNLPAAGAKILNPGKGEPIGAVSSSALAYDPDAPVALGMVRREFVAPGTAVLVEMPDGPTEATVFWPEGLRGR